MGVCGGGGSRDVYVNMVDKGGPCAPIPPFSSFPFPPFQCCSRRILSRGRAVTLVVLCVCIDPHNSLMFSVDVCIFYNKYFSSGPRRHRVLVGAAV